MKKISRIITTAIIGSVFTASMVFTSFANEWKQDNTGWWYLTDDGTYLKSDWFEIDGQWYYFLDNGYMATNGWVKSGNDWFYVGADGKFLVNTVTPDGYTLDVNGCMIQDMPSKTNRKSVVEEDDDYEESKSTDHKSSSNQGLKDTYTTIINKAKRDLETAQYELSRAENQKTQRVYREGEGFVYEADEAAIRKAQNKVDSLEEKISNYESKLNTLN